MRTIVLALALVFASGLATAESIKLGNKPAYKVGDKKSQDKSMTAEMTVTAKGQKVVVTSKATQRKRIEILAMNGDLVAKAKHTYDEDTKLENAAGNQKGGPSTLVGKTFTLSAGSPYKIEGGDPADHEAVRKDVKRFGEPDRMRTALAGRTFDKDKPVALDPADLAHMFDEKNTTLKTATFTYRGMAGKLAKFDVRIVFEVGTKTDAIVFDLGGAALVDPATADAIDLTFAGKLKGTGSAPLDGTMSMVMRQK